MRARGRPPALSREKILDAAMQMNVAELSIVQLARQLEVSEGAIYYYFRQREDLVRAVMARSAIEFDYGDLEGDWQTVLTDYSLKLFDALVEKPGRARYFLSAGISNLEQMRVFVRVMSAVMSSGIPLERALSVYRLYIMTAIRAAHSHDEYHAYWDSCPDSEMAERYALLQQATELEGVDFMPVSSDPDYFCERKLLVDTLATLGKGLAAE
ncbi:MAG: helix-turn-helix domain-containing protein [Pseudomonadota bacterium]